MKINERLQLIIILVFAAIVIFYRLGRVDMAGDDAVYSARAIGMVDFMFTNPEYQSTPIQWFKEVPAWTRLSWHDHPLPLFYIQHVFLRLQESILFAKLPYALMALGTILMTYIIWSKGDPTSPSSRIAGLRRTSQTLLEEHGGRSARRSSASRDGGVAATVGDPTVGILAAIFLALNAHFIWSARVAYMESGVLFFITLAAYALALFLQNRKRWWLFGLAFGLALSVKFTTLFLIPSIAAYLWHKDKGVYKDKRLYYALGAALACLIPAVIYNAAMFQAAGHFSLQFARLFHQNSPWKLSGAETSSLLSGPAEIMVSLGGLVSWPYLLAGIMAWLYLAYRERFSFPVIALFFLTLQQIFIGRRGYALALYSIFLAPVIAMSLRDAINYFRLKGYGVIGFSACAALMAYFGFFAVNSHSLIRHIGSPGWARSTAASDNRGMLQLDQYLDKIIASDSTLTPFDPFSSVKTAEARLRRYLVPLPNAEIINNLNHSRVILLDGNINWFARVWLMERRRFYRNTPIFTLNENKFLEQMNIEKMYFVFATEYAPLDPSVNINTRSAEMEKYLAEKKIAPKAEIKRDDGRAAFRVYEVDNLRLKLNGS